MLRVRYDSDQAVDGHLFCAAQPLNPPRPIRRFAPGARYAVSPLKAGRRARRAKDGDFVKSTTDRAGFQRLTPGSVSSQRCILASAGGGLFRPLGGDKRNHSVFSSAVRKVA